MSRSEYEMQRERDRQAAFQYGVAKSLQAQVEAGLMTVAELEVLRAELAQNFAELNRAVHGIEEQNEEIAKLHKEGIELQQEVLRREDFQNRMEELIYQFQKLLKKMEDPESDFPLSTRYYLAVGILETVRGQRLSTVLIKGRDNKAAFEECVERASTICKQLQNHPEIRKAIEWAEAQERKRKEEERRKAEARRKREKAEAREDEIDRIVEKIRRLKASLQRASFWRWGLSDEFPAGGMAVFIMILVSPLPLLLAFCSCGFAGASNSGAWAVLMVVCLVIGFLGLLALGATVGYYHVWGKKACQERLDTTENVPTITEIETLRSRRRKLEG
jgi:hypothetical protein